MAYLNTTASGQVKTGSGTLLGVIVNSHTSGTFRFNDGASGTTSAGVKATGVLTSSGVFQNNETVTVDDIVYTFKTELTGAAFEVLIGASAAASLDNLKSAINASAGAGSTYGTGTWAHDKVTATTNTDTAQTVEANYVGTYANTIATTETCANVAWGAATLASGAESSILMINTYTPAAGSGTFMFGEGVDFNTGLYYTEGGTADVTIIYK
jgi:hypothetical protein